MMKKAQPSLSLLALVFLLGLSSWVDAKRLQLRLTNQKVTEHALERTSLTLNKACEKFAGAGFRAADFTLDLKKTYSEDQFNRFLDRIKIPINPDADIDEIIYLTDNGQTVDPGNDHGYYLMKRVGADYIFADVYPDDFFGDVWVHSYPRNYGGEGPVLCVKNMPNNDGDSYDATESPSSSPTDTPSISPSDSPTRSPSGSPSSTPSATPSVAPSGSPSSSPTGGPSSSPSSRPSGSPSSNPSRSPSLSPSLPPTGSPSISPSLHPSAAPSSGPHASPSASPSARPSAAPSSSPHASPSARPSAAPSTSPRASPSARPSAAPSTSPRASPSSRPSNASPSISPNASPSPNVVSTPSPTASGTPFDPQKPVNATGDNQVGSSFGDPHVQTWDGDLFDFHGGCDLVLFDNPNFDNGIGMSINIRTKIRTWWSFIERAVLRIGTETLEVMGGTQHGNPYWVNKKPGHGGNDGKLFTFELAGYKVRFRGAGGSEQRQFKVILGHGDFILFKTFGDFVRVNINAKSHQNFAGSLGLMGRYPDGKRMARDNTTEMVDMNEFGKEWQVRLSEPMNFQGIGEGAHHPTECEMPDSLSPLMKRRLLGGSLLSMDDAEAACAEVGMSRERELCIEDVLATNDVRMAGVYLN